MNNLRVLSINMMLQYLGQYFNIIHESIQQHVFSGMRDIINDNISKMMISQILKLKI